jgi:hypothetical protein
VFVAGSEPREYAPLPEIEPVVPTGDGAPAAPGDPPPAAPPPAAPPVDAQPASY